MRSPDSTTCGNRDQAWAFIIDIIFFHCIEQHRRGLLLVRKQLELSQVHLCQYARNMLGEGMPSSYRVAPNVKSFESIQRRRKVSPKEKKAYLMKLMWRAGYKRMVLSPGATHAVSFQKIPGKRGQGVVAAKSIPYARVLGIYPGFVYTMAKYVALVKSGSIKTLGYAYELPQKGLIIDPVNLLTGKVHSIFKHDFAPRLNEPSDWETPNVAFHNDLKNNIIYIKTLRPIRPGEELVLCYGSKFGDVFGPGRVPHRSYETPCKGKNATHI